MVWAQMRLKRIKPSVLPRTKLARGDGVGADAIETEERANCGHLFYARGDGVGADAIETNLQ